MAAQAQARGAPSAAAAALEAAASVSEHEVTRADRTHRALVARWANAETEAVVTLGRPLLDSATDPVRRARLALMVGEALVWWEGPPAGARLLVAEAERVAGEDGALAATLDLFAANANLVALEPATVLEIAERASARAAEAGDLGLPIMAGAMLALARLMTGDAEAGRAGIDPVAQLCPALLDADVEGAAPMSQVVATALVAQERWDEADALLHKVLANTERTGFVGMQSYAYDQLIDLDWRRGRWAEASTRVHHVLTFSEGQTQPFIHQGLLRRARLDACRGRIAEARPVAIAALEVGQATGLRTLIVWAREVLALTALADDDRGEAGRHLDALGHLMTGADVGHPGLVWWQAAHVETLAALGRHGDARAALARLEQQAARVGGRWAPAAAARGRAALADRPADAVAALDEAVRLLEELGAGFEVALALAARGDAHARSGDARAATSDLADARARFDHLDARPWADRVAAAGGPAPTTPGSLVSLLTDAELRVALAVGEGRTNRQSADHLYLSVKTVDSHLQAIYRKLQITSRAQLAARVAREAPVASAP